MSQSPQESQRRDQRPWRKAIWSCHVDTFRSCGANCLGIVESPQEQFLKFLEEVKVTDMLVVVQHQEPVIQKVREPVMLVRTELLTTLVETICEDHQRACGSKVYRYARALRRSQLRPRITVMLLVRHTVV